MYLSSIVLACEVDKEVLNAFLIYEFIEPKVAVIFVERLCDNRLIRLFTVIEDLKKELDCRK